MEHLVRRLDTGIRAAKHAADAADRGRAAGVCMGDSGEEGESDEDDQEPHGECPWALNLLPLGASPYAAPGGAAGGALAAALEVGVWREGDSSGSEGPMQPRPEAGAGRKRRRRGYDEAEAQHVLDVTLGLRQPAGTRSAGRLGEGAAQKDQPIGGSEMARDGGVDERQVRFARQQPHMRGNQGPPPSPPPPQHVERQEWQWQVRGTEKDPKPQCSNLLP